MSTYWHMQTGKPGNAIISYIIKSSRLFPVFFLFLVAATALQLANGAYTSEFGGHPDEASHYVTGLMVRDFIVSGALTQPVQFAENYYLHYPKVALGHWPPVFYVVQALWTLFFSVSRAGVLVLMALLSATLAFTTYRIVEKDFGSMIGLSCGLLLIFLPLTQENTSQVMPEILLTLFSFWAVIYFGRFIIKGHGKDAISFSVLSALAILTKGNGLALALVPPLALLFTRRFDLVASWCFWIIPLIVLVVCGPIYWEGLHMMRNGWQESAPTLGFTGRAMPYYGLQMIAITGPFLVIFVIIGFVERVLLPSLHGGAKGKWAVAGAWPISVLIFHCLVPSGLEARYLILAVPALMMLLAAGMLFLAQKLPLRRISLRQKLGFVTAAVLTLFAVETLTFPMKAWSGFGEIAGILIDSPVSRNPVFLVSSDARGEGMFVSEVAMRDRRPNRIVLRASKVLSISRWNGDEYELLYRNPKEMMAFLESVPVGVLVVDGSIPVNRKAEHHRLLEEALETNSHHWELLGTFSLTRDATLFTHAISLYRLRDHEMQRLGKIRVNMLKTLGRYLEKSFTK